MVSSPEDGGSRFLLILEHPNPKHPNIVIRIIILVIMCGNFEHNLETTLGIKNGHFLYPL
jgi:hypothetical protein